MKRKTLFRLIIALVFFAAVLGITYHFRLPPQLNRNNTVASPGNTFGWKFPIAKFPSTGPNQDLAYSDIRDPGGTPQGLPVRLKIPTIGVDSAIEDAFITQDGRMDVPAGSVNVAWFALGPHPGRVGSAVIGGHFGIDNGKPKVFYDLNKLKGGDKVYIVDDKGDTLAFVVRSIVSFDRNADATTVFTSGDGLAHLNLITCEGIWNQVNDSYPERRVVFTDAIPSEGPVAVKAKPPSTAKAITTPEANTSPAQVPTVSPNSTPTEKIATPDSEKNSPASPQVLIQSAKSLYATPTDGLITSFLLLLIIFIALKIIRK